MIYYLVLFIKQKYKISILQWDITIILTLNDKFVAKLKIKYYNELLDNPI
jgi:hypothetical protein